MLYELTPAGVMSRISLNGSGGEIVLSASGIRSERTGVHSLVSIYHGTVLLAEDTFNIGRNEEKARLAKSAHPGLPMSVQKSFILADLKHNLDLFTHGLWDFWQEREPAVEILTDRDDPVLPPAWLLEPFILENQPNLLYAERSSVKSLTALVFATILCLQWADNPFGIKPPTSYCESLYLDFERTETVVRYNLWRLQRGMELPGIPLHYKRLYGPLSRNSDWVRRYLLTHPKIKLVIVDSITPASGGELNSSSGASDFYEAERSLNITTLCLAHASGKDPEKKHSTVIGHSAYETYAGNVWEMRKQQDEESSTADICLYHRKPPAVYRTHKPIAYRIVFNEAHHSLTVSHLNPESVSEFVDRMTLKTRILSALRHGSKTIPALSEELSEKSAIIHVTISRLRANGAVTENGMDGKAKLWGLTDYHL